MTSPRTWPCAMSTWRVPGAVLARRGRHARRSPGAHRRFAIRAGGPAAPARTLSGGNHRRWSSRARSGASRACCCGAAHAGARPRGHALRHRPDAWICATAVAGALRLDGAGRGPRSRRTASGSCSAGGWSGWCAARRLTSRASAHDGRHAGGGSGGPESLYGVRLTGHALDAALARDGARRLVLAGAGIAAPRSSAARTRPHLGPEPARGLPPRWRPGPSPRLDRIAVALNKATPYLLTGVGGGALLSRRGSSTSAARGRSRSAASPPPWAALGLSAAPAPLVPVLAAAAGVAAGRALGGARGGDPAHPAMWHEVLVTLLMNFIGLLVVAEALHGELGEPGAGFPQSPLLPRGAWLPKLRAGTDLHVGILLAVAAAVGAHLLLWADALRFQAARASAPSGERRRLRRGVAGADDARRHARRRRARRARGGGGRARGALPAHRGFLAGLSASARVDRADRRPEPARVLPAALFFGFLEAGALAMQRAVGVPSPLVAVIQG